MARFIPRLGAFFVGVNTRCDVFNKSPGRLTPSLYTVHRKNYSRLNKLRHYSNITATACIIQSEHPIVHNTGYSEK